MLCAQIVTPSMVRVFDVRLCRSEEKDSASIRNISMRLPFDGFANAIIFAFAGRKLNFDFRSTCYRCRRNTVPHKRLWRIRHACEGEGRVLTRVIAAIGKTGAIGMLTIGTVFKDVKCFIWTSIPRTFWMWLETYVLEGFSCMTYQESR